MASRPDESDMGQVARVVEEIRNTDVHGKDLTGNAAAKKREVTRRLKEMYALKNHELQATRRMTHSYLWTTL